MFRLSTRLLLLLLTAVLFFPSCEDDDPEIDNEEELITNMVITLMPQSGGTSVTLSFEDLDGDGGNAPTITGGTLAANTTYNGSISLENRSVSPAEDITEEVSEEDLEHQFFYLPSASLNLDARYADQDPDGNPLGLLFTLTTGQASTGTLTAILRHEPDKSASGVAGGDPTNAGGETDIEVDFPVTIQ